MQERNFDYTAWEEWREDYAAELNFLDLPQRPERLPEFKIGTPKRGGGASVETLRKSWQTRRRNRAAINKAFFLRAVLPIIRDRLNAHAWLHLSQALDEPGLAAHGGWIYFATPDGRAGYVHYLDVERVRAAEELGAVKSEPPKRTANP